MFFAGRTLVIGALASSERLSLESLKSLQQEVTIALAALNVC